MAEIDPELVERVQRWCAEAGRQVALAEIVGALAPLSWDELLAARALLADPPPARPLGPFALADLARGAPPDVAAEREREGRYRREDDLAGPPPAAPAGPAARRGRAPRRPQVVVRRARDRIAAPEPASPTLPPLEELLAPAGRAVLERLVRVHGGRRGALVAALAAGWSLAGGAPREADLAALLEHHGLARAYARRERDELLHALRAAGGVRARAAPRLGLDPAGLDAALARLGAGPEAEAIREERRAELRSRATLAERAGLLLHDEERLADLGLLAEVEADLRSRLPEHVRALEAGGEALVPALSRTLSIGLAQAAALAARFGLAFARRRAPGGAREQGPGRRPAPTPRRRPGAPARGGTAPRGPRRSAPPAPRAGGPASRPPRGGPRRGGGGARRGPPRRGRRL